MAHEHIITDSDVAFAIDPVTRTISNPSGKITLIQYDHNSERFAFSLPRFVEGHDMAASTSVQIHYINIGSNAVNNSGVYGVTDAAVDPENNEMIKFSWLVSSNCTQLVGSLSFAVRFSCVNNGITEYSWGTSAFSGMTISTSILNTETVVQEHADIIAAWEARIAALESGVGGSGLPEGGIEGQVLTVNGDGEYIWADIEIPESVTSWNDLEDKPFGVVTNYLQKNVTEYEVSASTESGTVVARGLGVLTEDRRRYIHEYHVVNLYLNDVLYQSGTIKQSGNSGYFKIFTSDGEEMTLGYSKLDTKTGVYKADIIIPPLAETTKVTVTYEYDAEFTTIDPRFLPDIVPTDDEALSLVMELGLVDPIATTDGEVLTDESGNVLVY